MRILFLNLLLFFALYTASVSSQQITVSEKSNMPMRITNNAVAEGMVNGTKYVYSFGGLDSSKIYSGISLKSFRYNTETDVWDSIPSLPDTLGKIASAASTVRNKIYIIGGYHVFANGNEISSNKVHVFDPEINNYLPDGSNVPIPIDDHVQCVWRDSLIYVITGWSNTTNVPNVQIYNPFSDTWNSGTSTPNNNIYKAFGASGTIIGDTIYYYGGASTAFNFPGQAYLRKGIIDAFNPTSITWSNPLSFSGHPGYRMVATSDSLGNVYFVGGSSVTYNYNGVAYNGSGGVSPSNQFLFFTATTAQWGIENSQALPMDLRGIANVSSTVKYIAGGMIDGQQVSNKTLMLNFQGANSTKDFLKTADDFHVYPVPAKSELFISLNRAWKFPVSMEIKNITGQTIFSDKIYRNEFVINCQNFENGVYFILLNHNYITSVQKIIICN